MPATDTEREHPMTWKAATAVIVMVVVLASFVIGQAIGSNKVVKYEERLRTLEQESRMDRAVINAKLCEMEKQLARIETLLRNKSND